MQPANPNRSGCSIKAFNAARPPILAPMIPKFFLFKENIYLINSHRENEIFAQHRTIFLNSFLEFNEKTYMLIEVNSWIHKITKNEFICKVVN